MAEQNSEDTVSHTKAAMITEQQTELQQLVEKFRVANLHLSNLLSMAEATARDEMETIIASARRYLQDEFDVYERLDAIADAEAQKGGAA